MTPENKELLKEAVTVLVSWAIIMVGFTAVIRACIG